MIIEIIGLKRLIDKFEQVGANFSNAATSAMSMWLKIVERIIKREKLRGQVLHVKTGMLRASIRTGVMKGADDIIGFVTAGTPYAAIHEFGGEIKFPKRGISITMPERSYIRSTLSEEKEGLLQSLLYESFSKHFSGGQK